MFSFTRLSFGPPFVRCGFAGALKVELVTASPALTSPGLRCWPSSGLVQGAASNGAGNVSVGPQGTDWTGVSTGSSQYRSRAGTGMSQSAAHGESALRQPNSFLVEREVERVT